MTTVGMGSSEHFEHAEHRSVCRTIWVWGQRVRSKQVTTGAAVGCRASTLDDTGFAKMVYLRAKTWEQTLYWHILTMTMTVTMTKNKFTINYWVYNLSIDSYLFIIYWHLLTMTKVSEIPHVLFHSKPPAKRGRVTPEPGIFYRSSWCGTKVKTHSRGCDNPMLTSAHQLV